MFFIGMPCVSAHWQYWGWIYLVVKVVRLEPPQSEDVLAVDNGQLYSVGSNPTIPFFFSDTLCPTQSDQNRIYY